MMTVVKVLADANENRFYPDTGPVPSPNTMEIAVLLPEAYFQYSSSSTEPM
jgi:hypothetical protein